MNRPQKRDALAGYALAAAIGIVALLVVSLLGMKHADAGGFRQASCGHQVVHQQAVVAAAIPYPVVGYQVAQYLQQQAVDEHAFRASPSKERLTYLEGYYQAQQERLIDSGAGAAGPSRPVTLPAATEGGQTNCEECQVPTVGTSDPQAFSAPADFAKTHPTLAAACSACHVDEQSKGGFGIVKVVTEAQAAADCETILALVDSIATGAMPKGNPMSEAERLAAIAELLGK